MSILGIQCPQRPNAPEDGTIHGDAISKANYEFEDVVSFQCNPGFDLIGQSSISCLNDGTWDNDAPTCQSKYQILCSNVNTMCNFTPNLLNNTSYYTCNF